MGGGFKRIFSFQYLIREIKFIFLDMWPKLKFNWISPVDTCYTFDDYGDFSQHENFKKDSISSRQNIPFLMSAKKLSEEILGLVGTCHEWERWVLNWEYFKWKRKIIWKEKKIIAPHNDFKHFSVSIPSLFFPRPTYIVDEHNYMLDKEFN